jgi:hypothetical protein
MTKKTSISNKNHNKIHIEINTEKKSKRRRKRHIKSRSGTGYSAAYPVAHGGGIAQSTNKPEYPYFDTRMMSIPLRGAEPIKIPQHRTFNTQTPTVNFAETQPHTPVTSPFESEHESFAARTAFTEPAHEKLIFDEPVPTYDDPDDIPVPIRLARKELTEEQKERRRAYGREYYQRNKEKKAAEKAKALYKR